jgi:DNA mismatch repair protein MutL
MSFQSSQNDNEKLSFNAFNPLKQNDFSDRPNISKNYNRERTAVTDEDIDLVFSSLTKNILPKNNFDDNYNQPKFNDDKMIEKSASTDLETAFIYQLHNKYILSQIKTGLMIIDQHVAHERILYEKALSLFEANMPFTQQLLFPIKIQFDTASYQILKELDPMITKLGFRLKFLVKNYVLIEGVPDDFKSGSEEKILREFVAEYLNNRTEKQLQEKDNIAKSYSCKAAIKAGDKLSEKEMRLLIDQLFATSMPYVCPHGRPIVIKISLEEFDKRFGRT